MIRRWADRWDWIHRAGDYDRFKDKLTREAQLKEIIDMHVRYAAVGATLWQKIATRLAALSPDDFKARDLGSLIEAAFRIESKARGLPTEIVEQRNRDMDGKDTGALWDALQHDDLREVLGRLSKRSSPPEAATGPVGGEPTNGQIHQNGPA